MNVKNRISVLDWDVLRMAPAVPKHLYLLQIVLCSVHLLAAVLIGQFKVTPDTFSRKHQYTEHNVLPYQPVSYSFLVTQCTVTLTTFSNRC
jgi:hypothetical protein